VLGCQLPNGNLPSNRPTYRHAHYSIGDYAGAAAAYRRGLELEHNNAVMKTGLQNSESRIASDGVGTAAASLAASSDSQPAPDSGGLGGMADALRNMAGGGGMPDLASMMNNPAMMQMAQQMMANGGLERLMSNPAVANMVNYVDSDRVVTLLILPLQMNQLNSGGGPPSMEELMANPELRDL
jgi:small glutamine-rich tetratricopeptide repeat-containing protein alpha